MKCKKMSLSLLFLLLAFGVLNTNAFAQTLEPPTNLSFQLADENDVTLFWDAPAIGGDSTWLHWDDGINVDGYGFFLTNETWDAAAKWDPTHISAYDGWYITGMRVYMTSGSADLTIKVWTGPNADLQYTELVSTFNVNQWTDLTLTTPYQIDASTELWAGIEIAQWAGTAPMGIDDGPAIVGYGDKMRYQGTWYDNSAMGFDANWNIQIMVSSTTKASTAAELLGYNVYRDGQQLNTSTVVIPTYVDMNLNNGLYDYYVTALYDEGESDSSNHIDVLINQPVILYSDSLALVDLYNACDGPNWLNNFYWLSGPVNEWWGVTTQGRRVTDLFLSSNNASGDIPESFGNLDSLFTFYISNNEITSLPDSFHYLTSLTEFWAGSSSLTELPDSFGYLPSLYELNLGFNEIDWLPESFGSLESLNWFGMYDGGLDSLPSTFGNLSSLETCFMGSNELTSLPADFGNLASIKILNFNGNQLTGLPESFGNMSTLENFSADGNALTGLPESFGNLSGLKELHLRVNQLDSLSDNFGELFNLELLHLSMNNLTGFPASFPNLNQLKILAADQNQITALPENIGDLPALKIMGLSYNQLTSLPLSIGELDEMTELFIIDNQVESIPETIGDLNMIRRLALGKNNLSSIPESIGNLSTLLYLDASDNVLTELPVTLGDIAVDTVFLFNNQISEIPESMYDNTYLILWTDNNFLQFGSIEPFVPTVGNYYYAPQGMIGQDTVIIANSGTTIEYLLEVSGEYNEYQWYKDGSILPNQTTNTLLLENLSVNDEGTYNLEVSNTLATELILESNDVIVNVSGVGINDNDITDFRIYPNPVKDKLFIQKEMTSETTHITIFNTTGKVVRNFDSRGEHIQINVSDLPSGIYLINIIQDGESLSKKFIKE